jgi:GPH family glycoside/pentoside/hexuronide:cation symporter
MIERKVGFLSKLTFSIGSIAYGVKDNGFTTFLMIYYNQVLGLSALYTGLALLIALVIDSISDPYVGYLSDNWQSKLGRRHPFMYAAILPAALSYILIWNPPQALSETQLFFFLVVTAILVRLLITFYEVPNSAMIAELESDYDRRTSLSAMRLAFGWIGGVTMAVIAFLIFLVPNQTYKIGQLNKDGYQDFAILAAAVMIITSLISALGTHRYIPQLPAMDLSQPKSLASFWHNISTAFSNRSFRNLFIGMMFIMLIHGITITLQVYFATYFFNISSGQIGLLALSMIPAAILAMLLVPVLTKGKEKRRVALILTIVQMIITNVSIVGQIFGILPENDGNFLIVILFINTLVATGFSIALQIVFVSMIADLIEDSQKKTGHRSEGLYFAAFSFSRKALSGLGIFASGVLIYLSGTSSAPMTEAGMMTVALYYVPLLVLLHLVALIFVARYDLTRASHERNLKMIK